MSNIDLYCGDCLKVMDKLITDGVKVDAVITDPPYGTTACKWDSVIPFDEMWKRLKALIKDNSAIVLFGNEPFSSALRMSNIKEYKYDWIWVKDRCPNFMMAKYCPLKKTENISVFSLGGINQNTKNKMVYYPQGVKEYGKLIKSNVKKQGVNIYNCLNKTYIQKTTNYPINILHFETENGLHPTQKPIALMEYLVKTYTNEGNIVLDFTMGSGTTGVACRYTNRNFIGIEIEKRYYDIAKQRIDEILI